MKVKQGLVGIADTRITSGREVTTARKLSFFEGRQQSLFLMSSGLRSLRDKTLTYFDEEWNNQKPAFDRVYKAVNALAQQVRRVAKEDREALAVNELHFNIHCLVGGQMKNDKEHMCYLLYPEGNWVEISRGTPYHIIGSSTYGKPVIDRTVTFDTPIDIALRVGCLAFDSTRISAADVDFPIDVVLYEKDTYKLHEHRFEARELEEITAWWQDYLRQGVRGLPARPLDDLIERVLVKTKKARSTQKGKPRRK
jgi:putative proteasome-type protease